MWKKVLKAALLLGAVGLVLGFAAPYIGVLAASVGGHFGLTVAAAAGYAATHPVYEALFFGAFGAVNAALTPIFDYVFGDSKKESPASALAAESHNQTIGHGLQIRVMQPSADLAEDRSMAEAKIRTDFRERLDAARALPGERTI